MPIAKRAVAEFIGTFWLVFGVLGAALLAAAFPGIGVGILGIALAVGLTVLTMSFAFGHVSGAHLNPAVSIGLWAGGRFPARDLAPYIIAQVLGGIAAAAVIFVIASGRGGFSAAGGFAANGYGTHSPGGYTLGAGFLTEAVMTFFFLLIIIGSTDGRAPAGFGPIAIGLCLSLIHIVSIPVTNTSVNPARSIGAAIFAGGWALGQLWLFIVAPIAGAVLAGLASRWFSATARSAARTGTRRSR